MDKTVERERLAALILSGEAREVVAINPRPAHWVLACETLVERLQFAAIDDILPRLAEVFPDQSYFSNMAGVMARLPAPATGHEPFRDDRQADIQVVRCPGSDTVLFCFCGAGERLGLPLDLIHRWLSHMPVHIVYLRGYWPLEVDRGRPYAGADPATALATLKGLRTGLGARHTLCWGNSIGGYAALKFGLDLEARSVLAMAAKTDLSQGISGGKRLYSGADLRLDYEAAAVTPRACLVYAAQHDIDRQHAEHFAGLPGITLWPLPDAKGHNALMDVILDDALTTLMDWVQAPGDTADGRGTTLPSAIPPSPAAVAHVPVSGIAALLISVCESELSVNGLTPEDDFYEMGGDSLMGVRVLLSLERRLGVSLPDSLFDGDDGRIGLLAARIDAFLAGADAPIS